MDDLQQPVFELVDSTLGRTTTDLFGMWRVISPLDEDMSLDREPGKAEVEAEGAPSGVPEGAQMWRVSLPSADLAELHLAVAEERLRAVEDKLELELPARLDRFVELFDAHEPLDLEESLSLEEGDVIRSTGQPPAGLPPEERELWLGLLGGDERAMEDWPDEAALDLKSALGDWSELALKFQALVDDVRDMVSHYARIETTIDGQMVALTKVDWTGDFDTRWRAPLSTDQAATHRRTVRVALTSRTRLMGVFVLTVQTAVKLTILASTGVGLIGALPLVFRFINQILGEYRAT